MRFLAIDLGDKRTGLALGDDETGLVSSIGVIETARSRDGGEALLADMARAVETHGPGALVVGLPLNMDDTEGGPARAARAFGERLAARTGLPVHFQDERLTTDAARWRMAGSGLTRGEKKKRKDALAAAEILGDFLAARKREGA